MKQRPPARRRPRSGQRVPSAPRPLRSSRVPWLALALGCLVLGFYLGQLRGLQGLAETDGPGPKPSPAVLGASQCATATITVAAGPGTAGDCCACPRPRKPRSTKLALVRKPRPPEPVQSAPPADPTKQTAAYLKTSATQLASCAPTTGAPVRVHYEVRVSPEGKVEDARLTNLEPLQPAVSRCVLDSLKKLGPPGFDGPEPLTFGLSVVL